MPHVRIIGSHHCGKELHEEFKRRSKQHDFLCQSDYVEQIVSSFAHKIPYEYYSVNWSVSIEEIVLENFNASNQSS